MNAKNFSLDFHPMRNRTVIGEGGGTSDLLYNSETEKYFVLDDLGALVWDQCDGAHSVSQIINRIFNEYEAPPDVVQMDLNDLLSQMVEHKLLAKSE